MPILSRMKPRFWDHLDAAAGPQGKPFSFRRKWLMIVLFTTVVTLTPLAVMTLMDYRLTRQAFANEATMAVARMVSNTRRSLSFWLAQRRAALEFIARDNPPAALQRQDRLTAILRHLQGGMGGVVDLAALDAECAVTAYAGPSAVNHNQAAPPTGCDLAVANGYFVSDLAAGGAADHRLVIAVRHDLDGGGFIVLRSTLDAGLLDSAIAQLMLDRGDDAFVVNAQGVLQTPSRHYGERYSRLPLTIPPPDKATQVVRMEDPADHPILMGVASIADSPLRLVVIRQVSGIMDLWLKPRIRLIGFLIFSVIVILISILAVATYLVNRIHAADRRRVQALHQVEHANKLASIGRLASGVAHEINNPLAIINQKAGLIKDLLTLGRDTARDPKLMRLIDDVLASVQRCGAITRRLLDFARHMESSVETVDIEAVIRQILALMDKETQRRCIAVSVVAVDTVPPFQGDRGNLQQIFLNLINNALAAMAGGGRLTVSIERDGPAHIRVRVADTGHGIPEADLERVFEPFFSTRHGHAGTGLGLSVTYGMVVEMGGEIAVASREGRGTCFTVRLPVTPPRPPSPDACAIDPMRRSHVDAPPATEESP